MLIKRVNLVKISSLMGYKKILGAVAIVNTLCAVILLNVLQPEARSDDKFDFLYSSFEFFKGGTLTPPLPLQGNKDEKHSLVFVLALG